MERTWQIKWTDVTDSTNEEVQRHIPELDNLSVLAAREQTSGRGQGDHLWHSAPGENLTFTIFIRHEDKFPAKDQQMLSLACAQSVCDYLESKGITAAIKLPNDVYVGGRKICGLLIRHSLMSGNLVWTIIGVGLNLNETEFPEDLPNPTSVSLELDGRKFEAESELPVLLGFFAANLGALAKTHRFDCRSRVFSLED